MLDALHATAAAAHAALTLVVVVVVLHVAAYAVPERFRTLAQNDLDIGAERIVVVHFLGDLIDLGEYALEMLVGLALLAMQLHHFEVCRSY